MPHGSEAQRSGPGAARDVACVPNRQRLLRQQRGFGSNFRMEKRCRKNGQLLNMVRFLLLYCHMNHMNDQFMQEILRLTNSRFRFCRSKRTSFYIEHFNWFHCFLLKCSLLQRYGSNWHHDWHHVEQVLFMEVMNREAAKLGLQVLFHELLGKFQVPWWMTNNDQ